MKTASLPPVKVKKAPFQILLKAQGGHKVQWTGKSAAMKFKNLCNPIPTLKTGKGLV